MTHPEPVHLAGRRRLSSRLAPLVAISLAACAGPGSSTRGVVGGAIDAPLEPVATPDDHRATKPAGPPPRGARRALVIGAGDYLEDELDLRNPARDADAVYQALTAIGVDAGDGALLDPTLETLREAVDTFASELDTHDTAVVFFAGHGIEVDGTNYLLPVDFVGADPSHIGAEGYPLDALVEHLNATPGLDVVIIDACRNDPLTRAGRSARLGAGGFAQVAVSLDTYLAFSTAPGGFAVDGDGDNSPFTVALTRHLSTPGVDVDKLFRLVRRDVAHATDGVQRPWSNNNLISEFALVPDDGEPDAQDAGAEAAGAVSIEGLRELARTTGDTRVPSMLDELAAVYLEELDTERALDVYEEALAIRRELFGDTSPQVALGLSRVAETLEAKGDYEAALAHYTEAMTTLEAAPSPDPALRASVAERHATLLQATGDARQATTLYAEARAQRAEVQGTSAEPGTLPAAEITALRNEALAFATQRDFDTAIGLYQQTVEIRRAELAAADPTDAPAATDALLDSLTELAAALDSAGRPIDALPLHREVLDLRRARADTTARGLVDALDDAARSLWHNGSYTQALPLAEEALLWRRDEVGWEHADIAPLADSIARIHESLGAYEDALAYYNRALEAARAALDTDDPRLATQLAHMAGIYQAMSYYAEATPLYEEALAVDRSALPPHHPQLAAHLAGQATLLLALGDMQGARSGLTEALEVDRAALPEQHPQIAIHLAALARVERALGNDADATPLLDEALAIDRATLPTRHPQTADHLGDLGDLRLSLGDADGALAAYQEALEIVDATLEPTHPRRAEALADLAAAHLALGDAAAAEPLAEDAVQIDLEHLPSHHSQTAAHLHTLARVQRALGNTSAAEDSLRDAVAIARLNLGERHPRTAAILETRARVLADAGKPKTALELATEALDIRREALGDDHPDTAASLHALGTLHADAGRLDEALEALTGALDIRRRRLAPDHPATAALVDELAALQEARGEPERARELREGR